MSIRSTGLSILIGALFAIPVATATAASPVAETSVWQGEVPSLILAEAAQQHQGAQDKEGKGMKKGKDKESSEHSDNDEHGSRGLPETPVLEYSRSSSGGGYAHNIAVQAEALGLSDEQLGKIARLHLKQDPQAHKRIKQKMKESMKAFRKAVTQPTVNDEILRKLGQEHIDSFNAMVTYHIEERKSVLSILTPEQIDKLKDIKTTDHQH